MWSCRKQQTPSPWSDTGAAQEAQGCLHKPDLRRPHIPKTQGLLPLAARAYDCAPTVNFFPPGAEDFNVPFSWGRTQQRKAGNPYSDQLFTVLLSSSKNSPGSFATGVPTLQVRVCVGGGALGLGLREEGQQPALVGGRMPQAAAAATRSMGVGSDPTRATSAPAQTDAPRDQVLPMHPLLRLGATDINATCRGSKELLPSPLPAAAPAAAAAPAKGAAAKPAPAAPAAADPAPAADEPPAARRLLGEDEVLAVPRVRISYVLNPVAVPDPPPADPVDRFAARYGAANATINPDMAEAEVSRQIKKLQELSGSRNWTIANAARQALQGYQDMKRRKQREEEEAARQEAVLESSRRWSRPSVPLRQNVVVGEFAGFHPVPKIKLQGLDTLADVSGRAWGRWWSQQARLDF